MALTEHTVVTTEKQQALLRELAEVDGIGSNAPNPELGIERVYLTPTELVQFYINRQLELKQAAKDAVERGKLTPSEVDAALAARTG